MPSSLNEENLQDAIEQDFACARCGVCCKGDGIVQFGPDEAEAMSRKLSISTRKFLKEYAIKIEARRWMLKDRMVPGGQPGQRPEQWCIFLFRGGDGLYGCRVNEAKPHQCREFPAQWRNPDSTETCVGLRQLLARMAKRRREPDDGNSSSSPMDS